MANQEEPPKHVLVVEDEQDFAALMESMLRSLGYSVVIARDGEEASARVRACPPDAITLDLRMPRKSGLLFYRELKSVEGYRHVPVIIVTGRARNRDWEYFIHAFLEAGDLPAPDGYVDKPVDPEQLRTVLRSIFARRQLV
jgi:CheY-like chemotaxis protein